ncbi:ATP-dependent helicase HrpB [bacterium A37T11]|nr:ATP-dependent helicase HrpB [bacterium A37T11]
MTIEPMKLDLPITALIPQVRKHLAEGNALLLSASPGAGKSTVLPLSLLEEPWLKNKKIVMLEPRRLAASSIANRMAYLLGERVGQTVGYRIRFENKVSEQTRIEVVTEGILTRMLQQDNALENIGLVIFDEFHERGIQADVALALCKESQQILRPDLRLLVMSATLDIGRFATLLDAPALESRGKLYPVEVIYTGEPDELAFPNSCVKVIGRAIREQQGNILAFLPGESEIKRCIELLNVAYPGVLFQALYGQLSHLQQQEAIMPDKMGRRKVVLATSIAETSLTIEGIAVVVDSGLGRFSAFDPATGLSRLQTRRISLDAADQRSGRAGRLGPGTCYRMWSMASHARLQPYRTPEILDADLAPLLLDMLQWGVADAGQLTWLSPPPATALAKAAELLQQLGAMENHKITALGRQMQALPTHPRLAHLLLMAKNDRQAQLATDVAALLEERDPLPKQAGIDLCLRLEALRRYRRDGGRGHRLDNIERIAASYRRLVNVGMDNGVIDPFEVGVLVAYAYPERIAQAMPGQAAQFRLANGKRAQANTDDDLGHEPWLAIAQMDARDGMGKIFMAAPLHPSDLQPLMRETDTLDWDTRKGGVQALRITRIGSLILQSVASASPDTDSVVGIVSKAIKNEGKNLLEFTEETEQWQNRVLSLQKWRPLEHWPDVSTPTLIERNKEWLGPYLYQVRTPADLRNINLLQALQQHVGYERQQEIDRLAPVSIHVPSGSMIRLLYRANGEAPVLSVRLQEVFGLLDTPMVNEGRTAVVLHLLSPGYKPVQVTADLRNFWKQTYFEVRKELKRRYPKHAWPEDPLIATAVRGVRKK